jgi:hypothetical protein
VDPPLHVLRERAGVEPHQQAEDDSLTTSDSSVRLRSLTRSREPDVPEDSPITPRDSAATFCRTAQGRLVPANATA